MSERKKGERFSRFYIEQGAPLADNPRYRVRLGHFLVEHFDYKVTEPLKSMLIRELGVPMPAKGSTYAEHIANFLGNADMHDVLDSVTLIHQFLSANPGGVAAKDWREFATRVFKECNLAYSIDEKCGVHPLVDVEFTRNVATAIAGLGATRYEATRKAFESADAKLKQSRADMKGAIRDIFEAAETLTKLISDSGKSLTAAFVKSELEPRLQKLHTGDAVATMVGARVAQSFADWVDAAHPYRHGQNTQEPLEPPVELGVLLFSQGASFLRWLADVDSRLNGRVASP